jgi:uncharacterized protein YndB with AHSA1/START domain
MHIHRSTVIAASPEQVWPFLVSPEQMQQWCVTIKNLRYTSPQRRGMGTPFYFEEKAGGILLKLHFVVTEWVLHERVAVKMTAGNFVKGYEQTYTLKAASSGTIVTITEHARLPYGILGQVAGLLRRPRSEGHLEHMLAKLNSLVLASLPVS